MAPCLGAASRESRDMLSETEIDEMYREMEVLAWFHDRPGPHTLGEIVDGPERLGESCAWDDIPHTTANQIITTVAGLSAHSINLRWVEDEFDGKYEWVDCPQCGSPQSEGDCAMDCDYGRCPGSDCDYVGPLSDHLDLEGTGSGPGYTGATIYWVAYKCGHSECDASADSLEAAR